MTDTFTSLKRSEIMSRIRGKNTQAELKVRKILFSLGSRYRLHVKKLIGKPDIVFRKFKIIIFVNGCFWHQHKGCKRKSTPKSNVRYWSSKLKNNIKKQQSDIKKLKRLGWKVFIIWECETKKHDKLFKRLININEKINNFQTS